jgi:hypothetical protein
MDTQKCGARDLLGPEVLVHGLSAPFVVIPMPDEEVTGAQCTKDTLFKCHQPTRLSSSFCIAMMTIVKMKMMMPLSAL